MNAFGESMNILDDSYRASNYDNTPAENDLNKISRRAKQQKRKSLANVRARRS